MKLYHSVFVLFFCFLPLSCIVEEGVDSSAVETVTLEPRCTSLYPNDDLSSPMAMVVCGNSLIMPTINSEKPYKVVTLPLTGESFLAGNEGRGPMDFLSVDFYSVRPLANGFLINDNSGLKRCHLEGKKIVVDSKDSATSGFVTNGLSVIKNGFIDMASSSSGHEFVKYTNAGKVDKYISKMPDFGKYEKTDPFFLYAKVFAAKPDGKYIAAFYAHYDRMKIMDISGNVIKEVLTDFGCTASAANEFSRMCYVCMSSVTDKYIPVLHRNADNSEIQVWDWNGNVLKRFFIPRNTAKFFAIDWKDRKLYYVNYDEKNAVYEADFVI